MTTEPTLEELIALALNDLPADARADLTARVRSSSKAEAQLRKVETLLRALKAAPVEAGPQALRESMGLLSPADRVRGWLAIAKRSFAQLLPSEPSGLLMPGFRGTQGSAQTGFTSHVAEFDIRVERVPHDSWLLRGQVDATGAEPVHAIALLLEDDATIIDVVEPQARGTFVIPCERGRYDLMALVGAEWVVARGIAVG